jgi:hypothetical protein
MGNCRPAWRGGPTKTVMTKYYFVYAACLGMIMIAIAMMLSGCIA